MQHRLRQTFDPDRLKAMAYHCGFILRERKLRAIDFVYMLVFSNKPQTSTTLLALKGVFLSLTGKLITRAGLHKRFTPKAAQFLEALLCELMAKPLQGFKGKGALGRLLAPIHVKDSTKVSLPLCFALDFPGFGGTASPTSGMSIQFEVNLLDWSWKVAKTTAATKNDQADSGETLGDIEPGSLNLRDLGYVTLGYMRAVKGKGAWFVNRLPKCGVKLADGTPFDWEGFHEKARQDPDAVFEMEVLLGADNPVRCRLVVRTVPKAVAQKRIEKAIRDGKRNKKGYKPTQEHIIKCHYDLMVTNLKAGQMPARQVFETYRLRWQVECCFKAWKSVLEIDRVKAVKTPRMACQTLARLIKAVLFDSTLALANELARQWGPGKACSRLKTYRLLDHDLANFVRAVTQSGKWVEWVDRHLVPLLPELLIENKKDEPTHHEIMVNLLDVKELRMDINNGQRMAS